jgi:hypothetical protein
LIAAVRDPVIKVNTDKETGEITEEVIDPGVADKRLLVIEEEFASLLSVMTRGGNILSPLVRNSWDGLDLQTMTKMPMRATAPHISMIAHSTIDELKQNLTFTEAANGFANRFLFACIKRSKLLPFGGEPDRDTMSELEFRLTERLNAAIDRNPNRPPRVLGFDQPATELWFEVYGTLSGPSPGLLGAVIARAEAQVVRLSLLYALLDGADAIATVHLEAAVELWMYCEESAAYIFGDALGDDVADTILAALRAAGGDGMTRTAISQLFSRNQSSGRIQTALTQLATRSLVAVQTRQTGGRPSDVWTAR